MRVVGAIIGVCFALGFIQQQRTDLPSPRIVIGSCKVNKIIDGDTIDLAITRVVRVRMRDCWAPETRTTDLTEKHWGMLAKEHLETLTKPGDVCRLEVLPDGDEDVGDGLTFGRVVGTVYLEDSGENLNQTMNASGLTFATKAELVEFLEGLE